MDEAARPQPFASHAEFEAALRHVLALARHRLQLFDPDFSVFPLGLSDVVAELRRFLHDGGTLQLAMHSSAHLERDCPRFLVLLKDYGHRIECRVTPRNLHQLTDSFCMADGLHIVRRFHSDHMRGELAVDLPAALEIPQERFDAIWTEARPGLHPTTTGL